jgi:hypothetical protein
MSHNRPLIFGKASDPANQWNQECADVRSAILAGKRPRFMARAVKDGALWYIEIGGVPRLQGSPGAFTQARTVEEIEPMAREVIAIVLGVPKDSFDLTVRRRGRD